MSILNEGTCNENTAENIITNVPEIGPHILNDMSHTNFNLNFLALNVCGLNSKLKYKNLHEIINLYDFICLSEIRTNYISPDEFPGYKAIISEKKNAKLMTWKQINLLV